MPITGHFPQVGGRGDGRTVIGPMGRRVADLARMLGTIAGPDGVDPDSVPVPVRDPDTVVLQGLRVAIVDDPGFRPAASTWAAVGRAIGHLESLGATVLAEPVAAHLDESRDITERYWRRSALSGADADRQLRDWDRFNGTLTRAAARFDVVLGPVVADVAPLDRPTTGDDLLYTLPWSLTGWPAVSLPFGNDPSTGLPLAVQIAAPRWQDHVALAVASQLEARSDETGTRTSA